ncbi:uncharacterized protein [Argopecten irradians]|uniref:uncharacterized protein n=1 Tax=Argopecten irradians TaxID=31199 RepID=UPI0037130102
MDIHAGYYSSDYPNPCVYRSSPVGLRYREPTSSHVYRGFRYNKTEEIIHEINRLRQENAKIELQSGNIKEDISSHEGDILDKLNSLRLLNMKLSTSNPNRKETADVTSTKTQVDAGILFTSTDAKEYNGIPPRKRYLEPLDHEKLGDGISTQDIFDRIDKLEANVKKVIRKHCRPKRHQYRETTTAFHQHTVSHISCGGIAGSDFYPTKETTKKSKRHTVTYIRESSIPTATSGHVGHERDFEAEAKRIVAEYHNSKERLRHEISRGNRNHSPDDKRISLSHEHGSQPYTNLPIQQDQHIIQSKGNVEERQPERESKQHNFHSKVSSIDTYRSDYTDKHTAKHDQPRNYASRNFQHIDEPIRKPKVWLKEERQSESEDTNTNSSRDQADNDCMLLILRPTRSVSGTIIGYDVAEDIPRNNTVAEMGLQGRQVAENHDLTEPRNTVPNILQNEPHKMKALDPLPNPFADKCFAPDLADRPKDAQQCTNQEIEIKIPFKLKLPRTPEGSRLSDDSQPNNVSSTLGYDKNTAAIDTSDSQLLSVQFCNEDAVSLPKANLERSVPVIRVYDEETELVTTVEQCHNKLNNGASTTHFILVLKREGQCGQVFDGNMEQVDHNEEKKYRTLDTEVRDGKITDTKVEDNDSTSHIGVDECSVASATVELTVDPATITPVYGFEQYSVTKENDTSLIIQEGDMSTDSTTEEETDERPTFTPVLDFALDSVSDEEIDEHPTVSLTSQLGITSVTEKNAVSKLAVDTDGNDKAVEEHPEITPVLDFVVESETDEDSVSVSLTDEEPDFHATNYKETQISGKAKDKSQCWGNYKEMSDTRQINEIKGITMKAT